MVDDAEWQRRLAVGAITEVDRESPTTPDSYVDMKYTSIEFMRDVAARGSETARFAFADAIVAWSQIDGVEEAVRSAARYPIEQQADRLRCWGCRQPDDLWHWWGVVADRSGRPLASLHGESAGGPDEAARQFVRSVKSLARRSR